MFEKRWTLELDDKDERYLRTIVDLGPRSGASHARALLAIHPEHANVTFEEQTVLEVALLIGLRVLARDLERELGTPLERGMARTTAAASLEGESPRLRVEPRMSPEFIGAFLKRARQKAGKTQLEVAQAMGVMVQQVGRFESGKVEPMLSTIAGFAKAIGGVLELEIAASTDVRPQAGKPKNVHSSSGTTSKGRRKT